MFSQQNCSSLQKPLALAFTLVLVCLISGALITIAVSTSMDVIIQNSGRITLVGLDAYGGDIGSAYSIALGEIRLGSSKDVSFYLRSVSNVPTILEFSVTNWKPDGLKQFLLISWNYNGKVVAPNEELFVKLTLNAVPSPEFIDYLISSQTASFSFDLSIYAVEA